MTAAEHEAREQRFARILNEEANKLMKAAAASTPVGGGDVSPTVPDRSTSLATSNSGEAGTVAPPKPDESPVAAGADEIWRISAVDRSPRLILSASSDGSLTLIRRGDHAFRLAAREVAELHDFITATATIRGQQ
ncbi:MAG: hypothetical protein ABFE02_12490 [Sulfuricella sp.]